MSELKAKITTAATSAMKAREKERVAVLRMVNAELKRVEVDERKELTDGDVVTISKKMVKQRQESARTYEEGGRLDLAEREFEEITVIEEFLPRQLDDGEVIAAIDAAIAEVGAGSIRDMGKIMGALKSKYTGQIDFAKAGPMVKDRLNQMA